MSLGVQAFAAGLMAAGSVSGQVPSTGGSYSGAVTFSAATYFADGTSSLPGAAFAGAHGTGMYRAGTVLGWSIAGTKVSALSGDGTWNLEPVSVVENHATNYPFTAADNGKTFTTTGASGAVTFTVPAGLPVGFEFGIYQNTTEDIVVQLSGSEVARWLNALITTAGGTLTWTGAGSISIGCYNVFKKVTSTTWAMINPPSAAQPGFA
jgi:hypothetical protein